jgi:hypothetical protein
MGGNNTDRSFDGSTEESLGGDEIEGFEDQELLVPVN